MRCVKDRVIDRRGTTLVELTVAVAIVAAVFAAVMPLFAGIRNSADARWANLEMVQNARVLNEQLCRCLAAAGRVTAVSSDTDDDGYVQFEAADGVSYRCALGDDGWVRFGPVDDLSELIGPVDSLRFVCYDGNDLANPAAASEAVRLVTWEAGLRSEGSMTRGKTIRGACCLRVAAREEEVVATYDFASSRPGVDCFAFADQGEPQAPDSLAVPAKAVESRSIRRDRRRRRKTPRVSRSPMSSQFAQVRLAFEIDAGARRCGCDRRHMERPGPERPCYRPGRGGPLSLELRLFRVRTDPDRRRTRKRRSRSRAPASVLRPSTWEVRRARPSCCWSFPATRNGARRQTRCLRTMRRST